MKLGVDITCFKGTGGGIIKGIQYLINACKKYYPDLEVVSFSGRFDLRNDFNFYNKKYFYIPMPFKLHEKYLKSKLADCDFLLFGNNGEHATMFSEFSEKNVSIIHDVLPLEIPNYFKSENLRQAYITKMQSIIDISKIIYTTSEYSKKQILANFDCKSPIYIIPWGITIPEIDGSENDSSIKEPYFIFNGGYDRRKGMISLLKAFLLAHKKGNFKSKLLFTGRPKYFSEEFVQLVKEAKKQKILIELGFVENVKLAKLIKNARALVYPSKYEGFGLPLLEGMMLDCPVIAAHGTCIDEITQDACLYADLDDISSFADMLIDMEKNETLRNELVKKGRIIVKKYSWEKASNIFIENLR